MKKFVVLVLVSILYYSCNTNSTEDTVVRYSTTSEEVNTIKNFLKAYEAEDWETWVGHYADTAKIYNNTWRTSETVTDALNSHKRMISYLSSYQFFEDEVYFEMIVDDEGQTWVNFWGVWEGTFSNSETHLEIPVHLTLQMIDNKIVKQYGYWDRTLIVKELDYIASLDNEEDQSDEVKE